MEDPRRKSTVSTVETNFEIVHALQHLGCAQIKELAETVDVAPSTVHRHLLTLREHGYVTKNGEKYQLGMRFLTLGGHVQTAHPTFDLARRKVDQVANETGERVQFIVEEQGFRIYLYTQTGENAVQTDASIGKRGYLHTSAAGKVILANFPQERVEAIVDELGLPATTPNTITDREELFAELESIRERGYAYNYEETTPGLRAVGSVVCGPNDEVVGALSISGPAHRFTGETFEQELPNLVLGSTNEIELKLKFR
ncbi:IclR family transcriptional regulator [Halegenticoccus tardaugens]|uniref:IclR family transcriptional regulator n=1 Tax=Halegenticoccus tardaugens TaxID=2071624 RepID=UPI00100B537B|nr:IclR family transcriptional regulator [Halegenticoccus tardaugens]